MIKGFNHIGLAVKSIDDTAAFLQKAYGAKIIETVRYEEAGQISCLVQFGDARYELMEPTRGEGVIGAYLEKHGEGFHHISLLSDDWETDVASLEKLGVKIIGRSEDGGMRYAFTHPKTTGGIVYEIAGKIEKS